MLYQAFNSRADIHNDIALYRGTDFNVPHWHGAAELLTVESGTVMLRVDRSEVCVRNGQSALVMPNQLHAFHAEPGAVFWVHVFSGNQVPAFFGWAENRVPKSPVFVCKEETRRFYCAACLKANNGAALEPPQDNVQWTRSVEHISPLKLKAVLYAVLADFSEQTE